MRLVESDNFSVAIESSGNLDADRLVLWLPGLGQRKDTPYIREHMYYVSKYEHLCVALDPPGSGASSGGIEDYNTSNYLEAAKAVVKHFERPATAVGHSWGGRIALLAAMENPAIDSAVALMTVFKYIRDRNRYSRTTKWKDKDNGWRRFMVDSPDNPDQKVPLWLPYSYSQDAHKYDTAKYLEGLARLSMPKLFVGGEQDTVVTTEEARGTYDAAGEPKEWQVLEGSGHNYWEWPGQLDKVNGLLADFLLNSAKA